MKLQPKIFTIDVQQLDMSPNGIAIITQPHAETKPLHKLPIVLAIPIIPGPQQIAMGATIPTIRATMATIMASTADPGMQPTIDPPNVPRHPAIFANTPSPVPRPIAVHKFAGMHT
jgi:hypothetical protein